MENKISRLGNSDWSRWDSENIY